MHALMLRTTLRLAAGLLLASPLCAQVRVWEPGNALATPRAFHTATLLSDGRVLVAGGSSDNANTLQSTEIYDPAIGEFLPAQQMIFSRRFHAAARLGEGEGEVVLLAGGPVASSASTGEFYEVASGQFTQTEDLNIERRNGHTLTALQGGISALLAGGMTPDGEGLAPTAAVEIFALGAWFRQSDLAQARSGHSATLLADGRVLVAGGTGQEAAPDAALMTIEVFDPETLEWAPGPPLNAPRSDHVAIRLADGRVLVAGGVDGDGSALSTVEIFDPSENRWDALPELGQRRTDHAAALLADGRILLAGGRVGLAAVDSAEVYEPVSGTSQPLGAFRQARLGLSLFQLENGEIVAFAGRSELGGSAQVLTTAERLQANPSPFFPQLALGAGFQAVLFLTNAASTAWSGRALLDEGLWPADRPWQLNGQDRTGAADFEVELGPFETGRFVLEGGPAPFSGSLSIRPDQGSDGSDLAPTFFYNFLRDDQLLDSTGTPPSRAVKGVAFPVERTASINTGFAIRQSSAPLTFILVDQSGASIEIVERTFNGAQFINEAFEDVPDEFVGSVIIQSRAEFSMVVLRQELTAEGFQLTSIPATPADLGIF